jgi:hypothetical protein
MSNPTPPAPGPRPLDEDAQAALWTQLLEEMAELNVQLEYLRLLLRLGVRPF